MNVVLCACAIDKALKS